MCDDSTKCSGLNPTDLTRFFSQLWKYLDPELKNSYHLKRRKIIEDFLVDHPNYNGETSVSLKTDPEKLTDNHFPLIHPDQHSKPLNPNNLDINSFLSHFQYNYRKKQ